MKTKVKPKVKIKKNNRTIKSFHKFNPDQKSILDNMLIVSKNIYNCTLFHFNFFRLFKHKIFDDVLISLDKTSNKDVIKKSISDKIDFYFKFYTDNKTIKHNNNQIIYPIIKKYTQKNQVYNHNLNELKEYFKIKLIDKVSSNKDNIKYVFWDVVDSILESMYRKNFYRFKTCMLEKKDFGKEVTQEFIDHVKNGIPLDFSNKSCSKNSKKIIEDILMDLENKDGKVGDNKKGSGISDQNLIERLIYKNLKDDCTNISSDLRVNIMKKSFETIKSFYAAYMVSSNAKFPGYLGDNEKYSIPFMVRSFKELDDKIRLTLGYGISDNFNSITNNDYILVSNKKSKVYCDKKYIIFTNKKINKKDNYVVNVDGKMGYISKDNKNLIEPFYMYLPIPEKIKGKKISQIELSAKYNKIHIVSYTYEIPYLEPVKHEIKQDKSISIDLGQRNLMTIYNPLGKQKIIKGKTINGINYYYSEKIENLISMRDKEKNASKKEILSNRIDRLRIKRENRINNYFDLIVKWIVNNYSNVNTVILGYNENWKNKINMGRKNNKSFYQIPYYKLINKLKYKLLSIKKNLIKVEESYTSKCDALALEDICKHKEYMGRRRGGLFFSSKHKIINADLNGAMNIMRKIIKDFKVKGHGLYNPEIIRIHWDGKPPVSGTNSQSALIKKPNKK